MHQNEGVPIYGADGYGCSFSESYLFPHWVAIVARHEVVTVTPLTTTSPPVIPSLVHKGKYCMVDFIQYQERKLTHKYIKVRIKHLYFTS
jgi:hypothetical protein